MKFLFLIHHSPDFRPTLELIQSIQNWNQNQIEQGHFLDGNPLRPAFEAQTVQVRQGEIRVALQSLSHPQNLMSAYVLIECSCMEKAISLASSHPMAAVATIEVREIWDALTQPHFAF